MRHHFSGIARLRYPMAATIRGRVATDRVCCRWSILHRHHCQLRAGRSCEVRLVPRRVRAAGPQSCREAGIPSSSRTLRGSLRECRCSIRYTVPRRYANVLLHFISPLPEVRTLFGVTNALQNLTNWRVGRILMDAPGRDDVELANFCGEYLTRLLRDLVARCSDQFGCVTCSSHLADPISTTFPCRTVQRTFRLLQHNAVNVNTASLKECR